MLEMDRKKLTMMHERKRLYPLFTAISDRAPLRMKFSEWLNWHGLCAARGLTLHYHFPASWIVLRADLAAAYCAGLELNCGVTDVKVLQSCPGALGGSNAISDQITPNDRSWRDILAYPTGPAKIGFLMFWLCETFEATATADGRTTVVIAPDPLSAKVTLHSPAHIIAMLDGLLSYFQVRPNPAADLIGNRTQIQIKSVADEIPRLINIWTEVDRAGNASVRLESRSAATERGEGVGGECHSSKP
jgi:hypothetical protein